MLNHPRAQIGQDVADPVDAIGQQFGGQHRHIRAGHHGLKQVVRSMHSASQREIERDAPVKHGDPAKRQAQIVRGAEMQVGHYLKLLQVEVGLVEAIEQHQRSSAGIGEAAGHMRQRGKERAELNRYRDVYARTDITHQRDIRIFQFRAAKIRIGWQIVDVQLERIGAGLLNPLRILDPSA